MDPRAKRRHIQWCQFMAQEKLERVAFLDEHPALIKTNSFWKIHHCLFVLLKHIMREKKWANYGMWKRELWCFSLTILYFHTSKGHWTVPDNTLSRGIPCCNLTAILFVCSETRSWLVHLSSSGPWPRWRAQPMPGTSADENVSPARRSAPGWRRCEAFSSWAASGSDKGGRYDGSRRRVKGQLKRAKKWFIWLCLMILMHFTWWISSWWTSCQVIL